MTVVVRRTLHLIACAAAATLIAACTADETAPVAAPRRVSAAHTRAAHDDIVGDTTLCRSGFTVIDGRYVCNPE